MLISIFKFSAYSEQQLRKVLIESFPVKTSFGKTSGEWRIINPLGRTESRGQSSGQKLNPKSAVETGGEVY